MQIDRKLNLVVPVERDDGTTIWIHSMPLSQEVFERYFLIISKTFAAIYSEGINVVGGPRVAALMLKRIAELDGSWEGAEGVAAGLKTEIQRLSNVVTLHPENGWVTSTLYEAQRAELLSPDELSEAEGFITFFMVASAMHKRSQLVTLLDGLSRLWGALTTSSSVTEWAASLKTSTAAETSGAKVTRSSIPS